MQSEIEVEEELKCELCGDGRYLQWQGVFQYHNCQYVDRYGCQVCKWVQDVFRSDDGFPKDENGNYV